MTKGVKIKICIQPNAEGHILIALPGNKIAALSKRRWPRLHRLLQEIYDAAQEEIPLGTLSDGTEVIYHPRGSGPFAE